MKTINFIISLFVILTTISCINRDKIDPPSDNTDSNSTVTPHEIELLTKYSWRECKHYARLNDTFMYDFSNEFLIETCDTNIFTFYDDYSFTWRGLCENDPAVEYWQYDPNKQKIHIFFDEAWTDYDKSLRIEEITDDSLKLFFIPEDNPDELVEGNLLYFYSIPIENH